MNGTNYEFREACVLQEQPDGDTRVRIFDGEGWSEEYVPRREVFCGLLVGLLLGFCAALIFLLALWLLS